MDISCYYIKLLALYANRFLYGYKCDMTAVYNELQLARRMYYIELNKTECGLKGPILNELNKFKANMNKNYTTYCRTC